MAYSKNGIDHDDESAATRRMNDVVGESADPLLVKLVEEIKSNYKFSRRKALLHLLDELIKEQRAAL